MPNTEIFQQRGIRLSVATKTTIAIFLSICTAAYDVLLLTGVVVMNFHLISAILLAIAIPTILLCLSTYKQMLIAIKILISLLLTFSAGVYMLFLMRGDVDLAQTFAGYRSSFFMYVIPLGVGHFSSVIVLSFPKKFLEMSNRKKGIWGVVVFVIVVPLTICAIVCAALVLKALSKG